MSSSALWRTKKAKLSLVIMGILSSSEAFALSGGFANMPLNIERALADDSLGSKLRVNPNVLFLIDDTGSMSQNIYGSGWNREPTRMTVTKEAMIKLADKHRDGLNYYVLDICGSSRQMPEFGKPLSYSQFQNIIRNMVALCGDPADHSTEAYYDSLFFLRKNMNEAEGQYRCQKNFLLYFGDGESNPTVVAWDKDGVPYGKSSSLATSSFMLYYSQRAGYLDFEQMKAVTGSYWDCAERTSWSAWNGKRMSPTRPNFLANINKEYCRYVRTHPNDWKKYSKYEPSPSGIGDSRVFDKVSYVASSGSARYNQYTDYSVLAGPADWVGSHDLVTEQSSQEGRGTKLDAAGKSWDDPDFPPQTIGTYAVGLGVTDGAYLNGASASNEGHQALLAQTPDGLFNSLDKILSDIRIKSELKIPESYSYTSPASLGGATIDSAVGVHLLEGTTRSQLRFFKYDHSNKKFEDSYTTPTLPARADRRFNPPRDTPQRPVLTYAKDQYFFLNNPNGVRGLSNWDFGLDASGRNPDEFKNAMIPWITLGLADGVQDNDAQVNSIAAGYAYQYPRGITSGDRYRLRETVSGKHASEYYMGDILDSPVVAGGANIDNLPEFLFASANDGLSYIFKRQIADPKSSDVTKHAPYSLALRYFPMEMDRDVKGHTIGKEMNNLRRTDYAVRGSNYPHQWMNNGGVTIRSMTSRRYKDSKYQYSMVVSTPGQGGRGLFALSLGGHDFFNGSLSGLNDSTKPWTQTIPLFETPKLTNNDLGYILGNPSVARLSLCRGQDKDGNIVPAGKALVFDGSSRVSCPITSGIVDTNSNADEGVVYTTIYGNGYRHPDNVYGGKFDEYDPTTATVNNVKSALHVRLLWNKDVGLKGDGSTIPSAQNGALIAKIEVDNYSGLSMPVSVDIDFDGIADLAYASTYDGDLYRFDFRAADPSKWSATKLFSTQEVDYKYLENDAGGVKVTSGGVPVLVDGKAKVKQKVMAAPDIFRKEFPCVHDKEKKCIRYYVSFGTGSNIFLSDLYDRSLQSTYTIEDRPEEEKTPAIVTLDKLIKREFVDDPATGLRDVKARPADADDPNKRGWYANFDSKDKFGYPFGERMVASPIMIKEMVLNNTVVYDFARKNAFSESGVGGKVDLCYKDDKTTITNSGWVMGLSPTNGDSNSPEKDGSGTTGTGTGTGSGGKKSVTRVSLDGLNAGNPTDGSGGAGKKLSGVTNYTLFHRRQSLDTQSSVTDNGGLLSGLDPELKSMSVPSNECMTKPEAESIRLIGQSKEGLDDSLTVIPKICPSGGGLLRLNLRDVPL
ncbi:MAG: PilC/PilY family type IV pilus protein [Cardiobacteriaceae bacterium]|nr:PilC/PilY family type IV pilus protein [Cardiobacteriaceae bacterium]